MSCILTSRAEKVKTLCSADAAYRKEVLEESRRSENKLQAKNRLFFLKTDELITENCSIRGTSESPRHTRLTRYRCSLPGLAGFAGPRCTKSEVPRLGSQPFTTANQSLAHRSKLLQFPPRLCRPGLRDEFCRLACVRSSASLFQLLFLKPKRYSFGANLAARFPYGVPKRGLASSSGDANSGCSAFQRIAAVIRVRPLG